MVAAGIVYILFYSQSVTGCKGYFLTRFNGSRCGIGAAGQITARCGLEAAVVDGISNVTCCRQFVGVSSSRRGYFTVGNCQWSSICCHCVGSAAVRILRTVNTDTVTCFYFSGGCSFSCFELVYINRIGTVRTRSNIGNLVAAVVQSACGQADRIAGRRSNGHAAAVGNGFVTRRIGGGYAGKVRSLFHANRNSRFACRSILGNFSFQIAGRSSFCGIACNNGQLFT